MSIEYIIVSPRVGEPGATFTPVDGVNIDALLDGGFITKKISRQPKQAPETITEEDQL
jgi:hypothetical protein